MNYQKLDRLLGKAIDVLGAAAILGGTVIAMVALSVIFRPQIRAAFDAGNQFIRLVFGG